jgi:alpha-1,2-mannosyltransferase
VSVAASTQSRSRTARQVGILAAVTVVAIGGHLWYGLRNHFFDLLIYRDAMLWWDSGHYLYDYSQPNDTQGRLEFTYPPFAAYLLRPLAWLTESQAIWAFAVVSIGALAVSIWWLVRPIADRHGWPRWFAFGLALVLATGLEPIWHAFDFGQINFVLWALILLDLLVLLPRRSRWAGVGIGVATAIKLVPGIFIVYLLVTRRWRAATVAAGTAVAGTLAAAGLAPHESWTFWTEKMLHGEGVGQLAYTFNQSLMGVIARLAEPGEPSTVVWILSVLPVLGYGMWRAGRAHQSGDEVTGLTLTGFVGSLVSPVTWAHHIFWFVPALLVLVDTALRPRDALSGVRTRRGLIALTVLVYTTVTFSMLSLWDFTLNNPGGAVGLLLSNWLVWLMLTLLFLLPIRRSG